MTTLIRLLFNLISTLTFGLIIIIGFILLISSVFSLYNLFLLVLFILVAVPIILTLEKIEEYIP